MSGPMHTHDCLDLLSARALRALDFSGCYYTLRNTRTRNVINMPIASDSASLSRLSFMIAVFLMIALSVLSCARHVPDKGSGDALPASIVPNSALSLNDRVLAIDALATEDLIHAVWLEQRENPNQSWNPSYKVAYSRTSGDLTSWSSPRQIADGERGPLALASVASELHLFHGPRLEHLTSLDVGRSWESGRQMLNVADEQVLGLDVLERENNLILAYTTWRRGETSDVLKVYSDRIPSSGRPKLIGTYVVEGTHQPAPALVESAEGIYLAVVLNRNADQRPDIEDTSYYSAIYYARSADGGNTWSSPGQQEALSQVGTLPSLSSDVALASQGSRVELFVTGVGVHYFGLNHGIWSAPQRIAPSSRSAVSHRTWSPRVLPLSDNTSILVWIDERFQESDRSVLNPFGGLPWSDDPDWVNNDILFRIGITTEKAESEVRRLTVPLSYISDLDVVASTQGALVLWAGRREVGKHLTSKDEPPMVMYSILDLLEPD